MAKKHVFISYCRDNRNEVAQLRKDLVAAGEKVWWDRDILPGRDWKNAIRQAMDESYAVVLCLSQETAARITSGIYPEVSDAIVAYREYTPGNIFLIPVHLSECETPAIEIDGTRMLNRIQHLNLYPNSVRSEGIEHLLLALRETPHHPSKQSPAVAESVQINPYQYTANHLSNTLPTSVSLSRLPSAGEHMIGREYEIERFNQAWDNKNERVVSIVAWGGVGKTALVQHWLSRLSNYGGANKVFGWSFDNQGGDSNHAASSDTFFAEALAFFGGADFHQAESPHQRGERLAQLVGLDKNLLILDGLEPLQYPVSQSETGKLKDPSLAALIRGLGTNNQGLCVITTREEIKDIAHLKTTSCPVIELKQLSEDSGADLLSKLGVKGPKYQLRKACQALDGHALAITLLGTYLVEAYEGDVHHYKDIVILEEDERQGGHARRVMSYYEDQLKKKPELLSILNLLGLFDRPATKGEINALKEPPSIPGLTENLVDLSLKNWNFALNYLRKAKLIADVNPETRDVVDAHPLIREYFGNKLRLEKPDAWKKGHSRLFEYLKLAAPEKPETLESMQPLYHAIMHGCKAGQYADAYRQVYNSRVLRNKEYFSTSKLGAFGADLKAVTNFFQHSWNIHDNGLSTEEQAQLLDLAGFRLRALERLEEAMEPWKVGLKLLVEQKNWGMATKLANHISQLQLVWGMINEATSLAQYSVELADRSNEKFQQMVSRITLANTLYQIGQFDEAENTFIEAEKMQRELEPERPLLHALRGYLYCDLLLNRGESQMVHRVGEILASKSNLSRSHVSADTFETSIENFQEIRNRIEKIRNWPDPADALLIEALNDLSLGHAFGLEEKYSDSERYNQSLEYLNKAVEGLRKAGRNDHLPRGLLARSAFYRWNEEWSKAEHDLNEVEEITIRGQMVLFQIDVAIEKTYFYFAQSKKDLAREFLEKAKRLVEQTEQPYRPHLKGFGVDNGLSYENIFREGEMIGYYRRNYEITMLNKKLFKPIE